MNERVTVQDLMRREYVGVSEGDPVSGAAELMHGDGVASSIVLRGSTPVGLLTADDVLEFVATAANPDETTVGDVMRQPVVTVRPDQSVTEAVETLADRDVRQLVVVEDGSVRGVLSEHDLLTAGTVFSEPGDVEPIAPAAGGGAVDSRDSSNEPEDPFTQGVCETCGSMTGDLRDVNGQLVCPNCRSV